MINNRDSPYIRGIGFMFIRFCQPPADLWAWMEPYLVRFSTITKRDNFVSLLVLLKYFCVILFCEAILG